MALTVERMLRHRDAQGVVPGLLAVIALAALYHPLAFNLARLPVVGKDQEGLGLAAPLLALGLAWQRRDALRGLPSAPDSRGWWLMGGAGILLLVGHRLEMRLPLACSLPLILAGSLCLTRGWRWVAELWFPLVLLAAITPLPSEVSKAVSFPMQAVVARFSTALLGLAGMPIERSGVALAAGGQAVLVSEGCSGWRSATASFWLLLTIIYLQRPSRWWVWLGGLPLLLAAGLAANVLRVITVVGAAAHGHAWALRSPWHELLGLVYFLPVAWLFVSGVTSRFPAEAEISPGTDAGAATRAAHPLPLWVLWRLAAALWILWGVTLWAARESRAMALPPPPSELPRSLGSWTRESYEAPGAAPAGEWMAQASYKHASGLDAKVLWQLPYALQKRPHRAVNVWLKAGAELLAMEALTLESSRRRVPVRVAHLSHRGARVVVVATHLHPRRAVASDTQARLWRMKEQLVGDTHAPWVTVEVATTDPESALDLERRLLPLAEEWLARAASINTPTQAGGHDGKGFAQ